MGKYLKEIGLKNSRNKTVWISTFIHSMDIVFFFTLLWILFMMTLIQEVKRSLCGVKYENLELETKKIME